MTPRSVRMGDNWQARPGTYLRQPEWDRVEMSREGMRPEELASRQGALPAPAIEEISLLIQGLPGVSPLPRDKSKDADLLTAKLLGAFTPAHSREILTYFTLLNLGRLEEVARRKCAASFLLLHPGRIAERALARSFQQRAELAPSNPFLAWASAIVDEVIREAVRDGDLGLFSDGWEGCSDPPLRRRLQVIAQVSNNLPLDLRRISYLVFFEGRSAREIAATLQYPLEQVEFILEQVFETVRRRIDGTGGTNHV